MPRTIEIRASFAQASAAEGLAAALADSGIPRASIAVQHGILPEARTREGRFVWRVLIRIVLWSIAGAVPGAAFGWLLAETIGPEGTAALACQSAGWWTAATSFPEIFAAYALLPTPAARKPPPAPPAPLLPFPNAPKVTLRRSR